MPHKQVVNHRRYQIGEDDITGLPNAPFALRTPAGEPLPHGLVTRDLVHAFYQNQMQINGGRNDGFVAWGDSGALVMGHYADSAVNLRLWRLAEQYTLCDNFFMGAFGGSFLNHQYLVAAQPPFYPQRRHEPGAVQHRRHRTAARPTDIRLKLADDSPASAMDGKAEVRQRRTTLTPDFWAVNTIGPPYAPGFTSGPDDPQLRRRQPARTRCRRRRTSTSATCSRPRASTGPGTAARFQAALDGQGDGAARRVPAAPELPAAPPAVQLFRHRSRPAPRARQQHLRDGGLGETAPSNQFLADVAAGKLPPVTFYKPQGDLNMHAGYSDVEAGDRHLAARGACAAAEPAVAEDAGRDHRRRERRLVGPRGAAEGRSLGAGHAHSGAAWSRRSPDAAMSTTRSTTPARSPASSPAASACEKLPGLTLREQAMVAAGGPPPGDLTAALQFDVG